eukprot:TRINITY_DN14053_c0_g1_i1.p1 TRINITY_DN14053_c0_g1~~TRINITY_DN14053_c0_g1_i1.p1  ORF type:complete len:367 (-),score=45.79 TRINITY_DN14053_c0_g1_i1:74-1081(-)
MWHRTEAIIVLGLVFHGVYLFSIFDIYFRSPLVHGMEPQKIDLPPPAKRLVLIIGDGLRADKLYSLKHQAPFLRSIIESRGTWGISHTRVPTETRPGHVAIISGFYEDVSAVTTGWKENPIEFDSLFNESSFTWAWGSSEILTMFGSKIPHMYLNMYTEINFAKNASELDTWVFSRVEDFFRSSASNIEIQNQLKGDRLVFFLHLLGLDTNGHAHRPYSKEYEDNIFVVDDGVSKIYHLFEKYFPDKLTAYVFTADHGMTDKGSHGDGQRQNTETPLLCWGAGIRQAEYLSGSLPSSVFNESLSFHSPKEWNVDGIKRTDVHQADLTPLMGYHIL